MNAQPNTVNGYSVIKNGGQNGDNAHISTTDDYLLHSNPTGQKDDYLLYSHPQVISTGMGSMQGAKQPNSQMMQIGQFGGTGASTQGPFNGQAIISQAQLKPGSFGATNPVAYTQTPQSTQTQTYQSGRQTQIPQAAQTGYSNWTTKQTQISDQTTKQPTANPQYPSGYPYYYAQTQTQASAQPQAQTLTQAQTQRQTHSQGQTQAQAQNTSTNTYFTAQRQNTGNSGHNTTRSRTRQTYSQTQKHQPSTTPRISIKQVPKTLPTQSTLLTTNSEKNITNLNRRANRRDRGAKNPNSVRVHTHNVQSTCNGHDHSKCNVQDHSMRNGSERSVYDGHHVHETRTTTTTITHRRSGHADGQKINEEQPMTRILTTRIITTKTITYALGAALNPLSTQAKSTLHTLPKH